MFSVLSLTVTVWIVFSFSFPRATSPLALKGAMASTNLFADTARWTYNSQLMRGTVSGGSVFVAMRANSTRPRSSVFCHPIDGRDPINAYTVGLLTYQIWGMMSYHYHILRRASWFPVARDCFLRHRVTQDVKGCLCNSYQSLCCLSLRRVNSRSHSLARHIMIF